MKVDLVTRIETTLEQFSRLEPLRKRIKALELKQAPYVLAIGKTASLMVKVCCNALQESGIGFEGYMLTKYHMASDNIPGITSLEAGHPTPDSNGINHSRTIVQWLQSLSENRTLIVLISGGASALFEVPADGIDLEALKELNRSLLESGLTIAEMNRRRSVHSQVKAGKTLELIPCRNIHCFALSDVEGNDPNVIGSGSFFYSQAVQLQAGHYEAILSLNRQYSYSIVGDNLMLRKLIWESLPCRTTAYQGFISFLAADWARHLSKFALNKASEGLHLFGGEVSVKVKGNGRGGRCTHLALLFAKEFSGFNDLSFLAVASDGNDNLDGVTGASIDGSSWAKIKAAGIDPEDSLANYDSYTALKAIDAIIPNWKNPVNVNDIYLLEIG